MKTIFKHWIVPAVFFAIILSWPNVSFAQVSNNEEKRIVEYIDTHSQEAIALLERLVNIESGTLNQAGVRKVGAEYRRELEVLGFTARWIDMPPAMNRAGHLFAERSGTRGKRLLLIGHLDTVLEGARFQRNGATARGNGVVDMKGGDVVVLFALKALYSTGALDQTRIIVAMTGDEELPGTPLEESRRDLIEAAKRSDVALAFETAVGDTVTVARRGSSQWKLEVTGQTGHSSGIFGQDSGSGAVFEAARILSAFYQELGGEKYLTFNPSVIVGGTDVKFDYQEKQGTAAGKPNVIAQRVVVNGDLRFISPEQKAEAQRRMTAIVSKSLPRTQAVISFEDLYPAMPATTGNMALINVLDQASREFALGKIEALDPGKRGAGDISFVAPYISGLDGLGARGGGAHEPTEYADLESLPLLIKRAALLIYRLTR